MISSSLNFRSGLASFTAFLTFAISSEVNDVGSFTSTLFAGLFNCNACSGFFSQTAYTVFGSVTLFKMFASFSVAFFVAAQPLNVYPVLVGSAGAVTLPLLTFTVVCSFSSVNLPPLASNVTAVSSE